MSITPPDDEQLDQILRGIKIPPTPEILLKLNIALQKDHPSLNEVGSIIQQDAGLSGLFLKTVNSPMFALKNQVTSITHAISLLGIPYTVNVTMGLVLRQSMQSNGNNPPRFWESPSNIAMLTAGITKQLLPCSADEAYLLGLFHNAGHVLISQKNPDYADFLRQHLNHPDHSITEIENQTYNYDHTSLGYYLASHWGIPKHLREIILNHHNVLEFLDDSSFSIDNDCHKALMACLKMAEHIDHMFGGSEVDYEWQRVGEAVIGYLGLSELDYEDLKAELLDQLTTQLHV